MKKSIWVFQNMVGRCVLIGPKYFEQSSKMQGQVI